jgi:hypothetical protein
MPAIKVEKQIGFGLGRILRAPGGRRRGGATANTIE